MMTRESYPQLPFDPKDSPWPEIRKKRIETLLPQAMERAGVDAWPFEEMVVVTEDGAEYLVPPQEELFLVRS